MSKRIRVIDLCIYIYWAILMLLKALNMLVSESSPIMLAMFFLIALIKIIVDKYTLKEMCIIIGLMLYLMTFWRVTGNFTSVFTIITIIIVSGSNLDYLCRIAYLIRGPIYAVRFLLAIMGVGAFGETIITDKRIRYTLGFSHPNLAQYEFLAIVFCYYLYKKGKLSKESNILILLFDALIYYFTRSRTSFVLVILLLFLNWLLQEKRFKKIFEKISLIIYPLLSTVSIALSVVALQLSWLPVLGTAFSRFLTGYFLINMSGISLFGNSVNYATDNGYVEMLCKQGIIMLLLFVVANTFLIKKSIQNERWEISIVLFCVAVHFCMEAYADSILLNPVLIYMSWFIKNQKFNNEEMPIEGGYAIHTQ